MPDACSDSLSDAWKSSNIYQAGYAAGQSAHADAYRRHRRRGARSVSNLLREIAAMIRDSGPTDEAAIATARAVLRHAGAAARMDGGTWTGQWLERQASAEARP